MPNRIPSVSALAITALLLGASPLVQAEPAGTASDPHGSAVGNGTLEKFASAYEQVAALQQTLSQELASVQSEQEATTLQRETQQQMIEAVQESGLSVEQYNGVASALGSDPALRARFEAMVDSAPPRP